jgi:tRNA-splicing ligase RtcB
VGVLYSEIPSGVGSKGRLRLGQRELAKGPLLKGARWAVKAGYGEPSDLDRCESGGCLQGADPSLVSDRAYERGASQLGTLGSGNHFLEIQYVDEIFDDNAASAFGLFEDQVTVMIHTGSRGFGHQVCTDFLEVMARAAGKYGFHLPDMELACAPCKSPEANEYLSAMKAAANYAWANRQCITHWTREAFVHVMHASLRDLGLSLVYDVAHNIAKTEVHRVGGKEKKLMVHRKGATRAFPPGHQEMPQVYRSTGQPVIIPGDMGRASYVLKGTQEAMEQTWGSTCHGAGRVLSRHQAKKRARGRAIWRELLDDGIVVRAKGRSTLAEEMPEAYKDISEVVDVVHRAGISTRVARLCPIGVAKG